jgi:hypothetical protein
VAFLFDSWFAFGKRLFVTFCLDTKSNQKNQDGTIYSPFRQQLCGTVVRWWLVHFIATLWCKEHNYR